ncbi:hypothetical protein RND81_11G186900 [Saponaria officinalis]|uniref:DCD domain-containing protein n=1 Tax=Saponaria officinalis TaxID=3572 RepID=A0AAW1HNW2_SAPOF
MHKKKFEKKRKLMAPNETNPSGPTDVSTTSHNVDSDIGQHPRSYAGEQFAGYIFMCNTRTKPDCFTYRVFGLPASMIAVVEKIKPNTKLFLYDFEVKLLYGLYVADSVGKLALEPSAFQGRFPAQVKFSIAKDCLPLPVAAFKDAIGYNGSKFKQDLSNEQVNKLVSLFRPINIRIPHQEPLSFRSAARAPLHDVLRHPSYHHAQEVPLPTRGAELASDPYIIYKRYLSSHSHQAYHPEDIEIQQHNRVRYGHMPTISPLLRPLTPSRSVRSSSFTAAEWVAMASNPQTSEDQNSTVNQPSIGGPGLSHGKKIDDRSGYTETGYGYHKYRYLGTHEAVSVPTEQLVPGHTQIQGDPALPHTTHSENIGVSAVDTYPYHHNTSSAVVSYGQGSQPYSGYHQTPSVSAHHEAHNPHSYKTASQAAISEGSQPYSGYHQMPTYSGHQGVNNAHAYEMPSGYSQAAIPEGSQPYSGYHQTPNVTAHQEVSTANAYETASGYSQVAIPEVSAGYGYDNQGYAVYYQAPSVTGGQSMTNNFPVHAYENLPGSTSNSYVQSQGVTYLPQPPPPGTGVVVDNAYSYYHQGYYYPHHMPPVTSHQEIHNVPAQLPEAPPT